MLRDFIVIIEKVCQIKEFIKQGQLTVYEQYVASWARLRIAIWVVRRMRGNKLSLTIMKSKAWSAEDPSYTITWARPRIFFLLASVLFILFYFSFKCYFKIKSLDYNFFLCFFLLRYEYLSLWNSLHNHPQLTFVCRSGLESTSLIQG